MTKKEFLLELEDVLQTEITLTEDLDLDDLEEWDSLSSMAIMAYYKKHFGIDVSLNDLKQIKTVKDLIHLAGANVND